MNLSIFNEHDPSGKMSKEKYVLKNYPDEYEFIINWAIKNDLSEITFKEKVYSYVNNILTKPICKNPNCTNYVNFRNTTLGYREYCSTKCISTDPNIIKLKENISMEKWGTKTPAESREIRDKIIKTNQEKWGSNSPMGNKHIQFKSKQTLMDNWGVDNPSKSKEILEKRVKSFRKSDWSENYKKTCIERYGVENTLSIKEVHNKTIENTRIIKNEKLLESIKSKLDDNTYVLKDINYDIEKRLITINCGNCGNDFTINREQIHLRYKNKSKICTICNPLETHISGIEIEIKHYIESIQNNEVVYNSRDIISPKEIDIYIPDKKIAIEINGLFWHSEEKKGKYYHIEKFKLCESKGIRLINIWEDDWVYKNDIIKSILNNALSNNKTKIYSRKCKIEEISTMESNIFLSDNHILDKVKSKIRISLKHNDEIVSLMTFTNRKDDEWELTRFCNKINTSIIGSASKLFKYFINKYKPKKVISYSDNSMFDGSVYEKLNFIFDGESKINYKWVINKKREHKSNYRKERLVKRGYDPNKSETEIMYDEGYFKIWDCGLKRWIWESKLSQDSNIQ